MKQANTKKGASPTLLVILSFIGVILFGSLLLTLPIAHQNGEWGDYMDSIFVATSATCVTGLSTYANGIGAELTFFGQLVVLIMIQIGGLGFITILAFFISIFQRKLKFKDRLFLSQAVNSTNFAWVGKFVRRVIGIVLTVEIIGFILGLPVFFSIEGYSTTDALWGSAFLSISAFNNAGFDIFGATSLVRGAGNAVIDSLPNWAYYYMLSYVMVLIVLGGISFTVIMEIFMDRKKPKQWSAFTKIVLVSTAFLIVAGFLAFLLTDVIFTHDMNVFEALFQSITTRTAGFAASDQNSMSIAGKTISSVLMFIGGSPIGTAGGIKTTTIFMMVLCFFKFIKGKPIVAFNRQYSRQSIIKAMSLVFLSIVIALIGFAVIANIENAVSNPLASSENIFFEVFSAFGTTGLSSGITPSLTMASKILICLLMFFGRLGPITMFQVFQSSADTQETKHFKYIETDVIIG